MGDRKDDLQKMRNGSLHAWSLADKLHLVAIGIVDIHGATGQDGMLAVSRLVSSGNERFVLGVELVGGKFKCHVVELVSRRLRFDGIRFGNKHDHLRNASGPITCFEKDVGQCWGRDNFESEQVVVEVKGFFFLSRPKHDFGDTNDVFHSMILPEQSVLPVMLYYSPLFLESKRTTDPTSLLWSVGTEEETHQLLKNGGDHVSSAEPFKEGISASITSAFLHIMRWDTIFNE